MTAFKIQLGVWHPSLEVASIERGLGLDSFISADKGAARGTGGAVFKENYCRFNLIARYADQLGGSDDRIIDFLPEALLSEIQSITASGGRAWIFVQTGTGSNEISLSAEELMKMAVAGLGLSFDLFPQGDVWGR